MLNPDTRLSRVDFPLPDGPKTPAPAAADREIGVKAEFSQLLLRRNMQFHPGLPPVMRLPIHSCTISTATEIKAQHHRHGITFRRTHIFIDGEGDGLGDAGDVAGHDDRRPEFTKAPGKHEH